MGIETYKFYKKRALLSTSAAIVIAVPLLTVGSLVQMSYEGKLACIITGTALPLAFAFYVYNMFFSLQQYRTNVRKGESDQKSKAEREKREQSHGSYFGLTLMFTSLVFASYGTVHHVIEVDCGSYAANMGAKFGIGVGMALAGCLFSFLLAKCTGALGAKQDSNANNDHKTSPMQALIECFCYSIGIGLATVAGPLLTDAIGVTDAPAIIVNLMFSGLCFLLLMCAYETVRLLRRPAPPEVQ